MFRIGPSSHHSLLSYNSSYGFAVDHRRTSNFGLHYALVERSTRKDAQRTLLIKIISPFLFAAPSRYFRQLILVDPDDFWRKEKWPQFIASLEKPWNDFILYVRTCLMVIRVPLNSS